MNIGKLRTFNKINDRDIRYGFLTSLDGNKDVYFNERFVNKSSGLSSSTPADTYLVYEEQQYSNGVSATEVKLLSELEQEGLRQLYQECREQGRNAELMVLAETAPELFGEEPLEFFLPLWDQSSVKKAFQMRCANMEPEALRAELGERLEEVQMRELLFPACPALYLDKDITAYFPYLGQEPHKVDQLFSELCRQGYFDVSPARAYGEFLAANKPDASTEWEYIWYTKTDSKAAEVLFQALDLERETSEDLAFFAAAVKGAGVSLAPLLLRKPELLWTNPEICALVGQLDVTELPLEQLIQTDEQMAFLASHANEGVWNVIIYRPLPEGLLLRCGRAMELITDSTAKTYLSQIDWEDASEENLAKWRILLSKLNMTKCPDAVMTAVLTMQEHKAALDLNWWKLLSDSMKVRLLIYLSNFREELKASVPALKDIHQWESDKENKLILAMLRYIVTIYTAGPVQRQEEFLKAHDLLMQYILDCFNNMLDVTPGLDSLLDRCRSEAVSRPYFCEARIWRRRGVDTADIFCPKIRKVCKQYNAIDLSDTAFRCAAENGREPDYKVQFFADFLLNLGGCPDLKRIGIRQREEYPFRITAYVNGLIQLRTHMKCSVCGGVFHPRFSYARMKNARLSINRFDCPDAQNHPKGAHDANVYLNFCYHCHKIIDSRECQIREPDHGQFLCMHCGGAEHTKPGTVCPSCGCQDQEKLESRGSSRIICSVCSYDSRNFVSNIEQH